MKVDQCLFDAFKRQYFSLHVRTLVRSHSFNSDSNGVTHPPGAAHKYICGGLEPQKSPKLRVHSSSPLAGVELALVNGTIHVTGSIAYLTELPAAECQNKPWAPFVPRNP